MMMPRPQQWTEAEVHRLRMLAKRKVSADSTAKSLGRYVGSVKTKARELNLILSRRLRGGRRNERYLIQHGASVDTRRRRLTTIDGGGWRKRRRDYKAAQAQCGFGPQAGSHTQDQLGPFAARAEAEVEMISPDTKSPDSTNSIISANPLAARELLKLLPCQDRGASPYD
jgi:hypothetical protein